MSGLVNSAKGSRPTEPGKWTMTTNIATQKGLFHAAKFYAENQLHLVNVTAVRAGIGLRTLDAISGYSTSLILLWEPGPHPEMHTFETTQAHANMVARVRVNSFSDNWANLRVLQILCREHLVNPTDEDSTRQDNRPVANVREPLATIDE